ncbi:hypothetical protein CAEBREN_16368 [Caenorhabditis brenneri]|uniref:Uncharacterized protein n=1 Tax=Caenorhabditis brenneri TaxID=135651 RepID=G0MR02_CAEBE|nr:hypothetical protein CAEBREN_16368 [Caenorhabditis brenneri]
MSYTQLEKNNAELAKHPRRFLSMSEQTTVLKQKIDKVPHREVLEALSRNKIMATLQTFERDPVKYAVRAYGVLNGLSQKTMKNLKGKSRVRQIYVLAKEAKRAFRQQVRPEK